MTVSHSQGGQVVVEVHDSGPGLSDDARRTLFEPTITFKKRGMGLGLSIARKNALLLGRRYRAGQRRAWRRRIQSDAAVCARITGGRRRMTRKRHIVVVDDEPNIGLSLRLILEGEGYRVSICESVAQFQRAARPGPRRSVSAGCASSRRQRHRSPAVAQAARRSDAGGHDLRATERFATRSRRRAVARSTFWRSRSRAIACSWS